MKLNLAERLLVNNPARKMFQYYYEAPLLLSMGGRLDHKNVLEVGCGRGVGTEIVFKKFGAAHVTALDFDPKMVELARRRLAGFPPDRLTLAVGDASEINAPDNSFDAVFDFGIFHHIPDWQKAVLEVKRVLRPGGLFFFEEVTRQALNRWIYRTFLEHPKENRFSGNEFVSELEMNGIEVGNKKKHFFFGDFIFGVGRRMPEDG